MNFTCITNIPAFFQRIRSCTGEVTFIDESGTERDLKKLADSALDCDSLFRSSRLENLEVRANSLEDRNRLIRYMTEMNRI